MPFYNVTFFQSATGEETFYKDYGIIEAMNPDAACEIVAKADKDSKWLKPGLYARRMSKTEVKKYQQRAK